MVWQARLRSEAAKRSVDLLLCRLALRREELRVLQVKHIDITRSTVMIHSKGGKDRLDDLRGVRRPARRGSTFHISGEARGGDEHLLYAKTSRLQPLSGAGVHNRFSAASSAPSCPTSTCTRSGTLRSTRSAEHRQLRGRSPACSAWVDRGDGGLSARRHGRPDRGDAAGGGQQKGGLRWRCLVGLLAAKRSSRLNLT